MSLPSRDLAWSARLPAVGSSIRPLVGLDHLCVFTSRGIYDIDSSNGDSRQIFRGFDRECVGEALWRAGIDPSRPAASVSLEEAELLRNSIVGVLGEAIEARGTSFRDYRDARGKRGSFVETRQHHVNWVHANHVRSTKDSARTLAALTKL